MLGEAEIESPLSNISIYPNPSNEKIYLEWISSKPNEEITLSVFDQSGKLILAEIMTENNFELNKNRIGSGCFFYRLQSDEIIYHQGKFIITQ